MERSQGIGTWVLLLAGVLVAAPQAAAGQRAQYANLDRAHDEAVAVAHSADSFEAKVKEAAKRHARVADQRPEDDVRRFDCLATQASLLHFTGDLRQSRKYMERAAEHARATGDVQNAANAFVDAAIMAKEAGDLEAAVQLAHQARLLSYSPLLGTAERRQIAGRFIANGM